MNVRKYLKWMVLLALFFPPALLLIDFKSSKELQLMPQTEEEYFQSRIEQRCPTIERLISPFL